MKISWEMKFEMQTTQLEILGAELNGTEIPGNKFFECSGILHEVTKSAILKFGRKPQNAVLFAT